MIENPFPHSKRLGSQLRERRRALGMTQDDLAFAVGVDRRVIGRLERGVGTVRLEIALRALHALGIDSIRSQQEEAQQGRAQQAQTKRAQTKRAQTKRAQTKRDQTKLDQTKLAQTKLDQTKLDRARQDQAQGPDR